MTTLDARRKMNHRRKCKICNLEWELLPADAKQIGNPRGSFRLYLIGGQMHDIGSTQLGRKKSAATTAEEKQK
jgi:hypothetical protein